MPLYRCKFYPLLTDEDPPRKTLKTPEDPPLPQGPPYSPPIPTREVQYEPPQNSKKPLPKPKGQEVDFYEEVPESQRWLSEEVVQAPSTSRTDELASQDERLTSGEIGVISTIVSK